MVAERTTIQEAEQRDPRLERVVLNLFQSASTLQKLDVLRAIPTGTVESIALSMTEISKNAAQAITLVSTCTAGLEEAHMVSSSPARKGVPQRKHLTVLGREVVPTVVEAMQTYFDQTQTDLIFPSFAWSPDVMPGVLNTLLSARRIASGERRDNAQYVVELPRPLRQVKALRDFGIKRGGMLFLDQKGISLYNALLKIKTAVVDHEDELLKLIGPISLLEA